jgi:hypothetical protein
MPNRVFSHPLMPRQKFWRKLFKNFLFGFCIIIVWLAIGISGYMCLAHLNFTDAVLNSSMILGGMGPVDILTNNAAKYFASMYAVTSGVVFLTTTGFVIAPMLHRVLHIFHLDDPKQKD